MILLLLIVIALLLFAVTVSLAYLTVLIKNCICKTVTPEQAEKPKREAVPKQENREKTREQLFFESFMTYDGDPRPDMPD